MSTDKDLFRAKVDVSRETLERLEIYAALLEKWTQRINLVAPSTIPTLWQRHFLDSAQLAPFVSKGSWIDIGSGGGFPGAVLAIMAPETQFTLVESDQRKATFLRTVARETGSDFKVSANRIEEIAAVEANRLSARALASLTELLGWARFHLAEDGKAILLKGVSVQEEINQALEHWSFDCETYPSKTDENAVILSIGNIKRV